MSMSSLPCRILYHHRIASQDGQYVHLEAILTQLRQQGHTVELVGPTIHPERPSDAPAAKLSLVGRLKKAMPKAVYELMELGYSLVVAWRLYRAIRKHQPEFIYERYNALQPAGVWLAKKMRIPLLLEVNAPLVQERSRFSGMGLPKLAKWVEDWTWRNASLVLPVTDVLAEHLREAGVEEDHIRVVHNGVHKSWVDGLALKPLPVTPDDDVIIGFVGFMHLTCGVQWAIEALQELPENVKLVCVGDGAILPQLRKQAEDLGVAHRVRFTGLADRETACAEVAQFDIAIQPDVTAYASPLKMFEYLACRTLIVAPKIPNIQEILSDECAVFFPHGDAEAFKAALKQCAADLPAFTPKRLAARDQLDKKAFYWDANAAKIAVWGSSRATLYRFDKVEIH